MYHSEFLKAKDYFGKHIRDQRTGELLNDCYHCFIAKIKTRLEDQEYGGLFYPQIVFDGLELLCERCGSVYWVMPEDLIKTENWDKRIQEILDGFDKPQPLEKKPPKKSNAKK